MIVAVVVVLFMIVFIGCMVAVMFRMLDQQDEEKRKELQMNCIHHWEYEGGLELWHCCHCGKFEI